MSQPIETVRELQYGYYLVNETTSVAPGSPKEVEIAEWEAAGGVVTPFDPYYGVTLDEATSAKQIEIDAYEDGRVEAANALPYIGAATTARKNRQCVANRTKQNTGGRPPSQQDKARDNALADYELSLMATSEALYLQVAALSTVAEIMAVNVAEGGWAEWAPPE